MYFDILYFDYFQFEDYYLMMIFVLNYYLNLYFDFDYQSEFGFDFDFEFDSFDLNNYYFFDLGYYTEVYYLHFFVDL